MSAVAAIRKPRQTAPEQPPSADKFRCGRVVAVTGFTLLCPFLGSAEYGPAIMLLALAVLLWLNPPQRTLPSSLNVIFAALIGLMALAFLPAKWFGLPEWRTVMTGMGIRVPWTLTPQPWLTLEATILFLAGLAWTYFVCVQRWSLREHRLATRLFALGVLVMVGLATWFHVRGGSLPFWKSERNFGPFENRNNTANLFALGGLMIMACGYDELNRSRLKAGFWLAAALVVLSGLAVGFSKSGVLIFFLGTATWLGLLASGAREKRGLAVVASAVLIFATLFLVFGGETLNRFGLSKGGLVKTVTQDARWAVQKDALNCGATSAWFGIGLGNFNDVFPQFRKFSFSEKRALHPENDWLWLQIEMGWPAVALVLAASGLLAAQVFPLRSGTNQRLRAAAAVAVLFFALHGLVNVSGHKMGTVVPAVFLLGLALNPGRSIAAAHWPAGAFRGAAVLFAITAGAWLIAMWQQRPLPSRAGVALLTRAARSCYQGGNFGGVIALCRQGLSIAPLNWEFYYLRGAARALSAPELDSARSDFRRARHLASHSRNIPLQEGFVLLKVQPLAAMEPWREALRRSGREAHDTFWRMRDATIGKPELRPLLNSLTEGNWELKLSVLHNLAPDDFAGELQRVLAVESEQESLSYDQRSDLIGLWAQRGEKEQLIEKLLGDPEWRKAGWQWLAAHYAASQRYEEAYRLAGDFMQMPPLPQVDSKGDSKELERLFVLNRSDFGTGYRLYLAQVNDNQEKQALSTLRRLTIQDECPSYLHFLKAELHARRQEWNEAWAALQKYRVKSEKQR